MDHVPPDRDRRREHRDMVGGRAAPFVAGSACKQQFEGIALHPHRRGVAIGRNHPVVGVERCRAPDLGRLLSFEGRIGRQPSLLLKRGSFAVVGAGENHRPVETPGHDELQGAVPTRPRRA